MPPSAPTRARETDPCPALVVFDLDGTLVDSSRDIHDALRVALGQVHEGREAPEADERQLAAGCHGLSLEMFFARARPGASPEALSSFVAAYRRHYDAHLLDQTRPFPGVPEGLRVLRAERGLRLAVATTKLTATARRVLCGLGLSSYFDLVLGSDGLPCKPDPAVILAVRRTLGLDAGPGLMVGDTEHDIAAGRAAGLATCAVGWSELPRPRLLEADPDHVAESFAEVVALARRITPEARVTW